jgi:hypothetical protein
MIELWLPYYQKRYGKLLPSQKKLAAEVSPATLDRWLAPAREGASLRGLCGAKPGSLLRKQIPIQGEVWDEKRAGFLEADSVAHCGSSLAGSFIWSLAFTDIASQWTCGRALWNKGAAGVLEQTRDVEKSLPFLLCAGWTLTTAANGSTGIGSTACKNASPPCAAPAPALTTATTTPAPEQKNWMGPRQLLGYGRLEDPGLAAPINAVYLDIWEPLHNFFLPNMKLIKKWREGSRWRRQHDRPQTAHQRLQDIGALDAKALRRLRDPFESLAPFTLRDNLEKNLGPILSKTLKEDLKEPPIGGQ